MPEVKQQVNTYMVNYICDECKIGHMIFTGRVKEGIVGSIGKINYLIHKCTNCGKTKRFKNFKYPIKQYEVIPINNVKLSHQSN